MQRELHVRFGGRAEETDRRRLRHGASVRPLHLREDPLRLGLRRLCGRRLLPLCRWLASVTITACRSCARRPEDGVLAAARPCLEGLIHHSDRGVQYLAFRYTERLAQAGVVASVGSRGDSYDNALAESFNGLYKAELIRRCGPWSGLDDVEYATLEYVDWFNRRRLHGELGMIPPVEFEAIFVSAPSASAEGSLR